jgi:predicted ATPase with chaperone activity
LIYGKPGNGKSYLSEQLARLDSDPVFIPYVIEAEGQFVKVFDSLYHEKLEADDESFFVTSEAQYDPRWAKCKRPYLTTGGELTMEMLDLMHIPAAKIYDAPYQLKANNGIYLIDDFGRQQITPAELLNRWIYPLDRSVDYLSFQTGTKIQVPFECFLIFSSNLNPNDLGDEAFLRRLEYKLFMRNPSEEEFATIFYDYCRNMKIESPSGLVMDVIKDHYNSTGRKFRRCHPRDVIRIAIDLLRFENLPFVLTKELIDRAFELKFVAMNYTDE